MRLLRLVRGQISNQNGEA
ncbi:hypothetical protein LINPERHAP2_LOCUS940 [Linum perenne]